MRWKQIANQRLSGRRTTRLAHPDADAGQQIREIAPGDSRRRSHQAPARHTDRNQPRTAPAVRQTSKGQPDRGVHQREHCVDESHLCIAELKFEPDRLGQRACDLTIKEVHQIDAKQHGERIARVSGLIRHVTSGSLDDAAGRPIVVLGAARGRVAATYLRAWGVTSARLKITNRSHTRFVQVLSQ